MKMRLALKLPNVDVLYQLKISIEESVILFSFQKWFLNKIFYAIWTMFFDTLLLTQLSTPQQCNVLIVLEVKKYCSKTKMNIP